MFSGRQGLWNWLWLFKRKTYEIHYTARRGGRTKMLTGISVYLREKRGPIICKINIKKQKYLIQNLRKRNWINEVKGVKGVNGVKGYRPILYVVSVHALVLGGKLKLLHKKIYETLRNSVL